MNICKPVYLVCLCSLAVHNRPLEFLNCQLRDKPCLRQQPKVP